MQREPVQGTCTTLHYETADGPSEEVSVSSVASLLADCTSTTGTISEETLVWTDGMKTWVPLRTLFTNQLTNKRRRQRRMHRRRATRCWQGKVVCNYL